MEDNLATMLLIGLILCSASTAAVPTYTVGVLDNKGNATATYVQWQPTFETYANHHLDRLGAGYRLKLVALPFHNLSRATNANEVGFIFTNTGHSALVGVVNEVTPFASIENLRVGVPLTIMGGAAFTWNGSGVRNLADCGLPAHREKVAAVSALSFAGYAAPMRELADLGVDIGPIMASVTFTGNHDDSLRLCNERKKSCCFVRTDKFESNQISTPNNVNNLVHLSPRTGLEYSFFPFKISTQLYPEWVISAQRYMSQSDTEMLAVILFATKANDAHAVHGKYTRWVTASDLSKVRECLYTAKILTKEAPPTLAPVSKKDNTSDYRRLLYFGCLYVARWCYCCGAVPHPCKESCATCTQRSTSGDGVHRHRELHTLVGEPWQ